MQYTFTVWTTTQPLPAAKQHGKPSWDFEKQKTTYKLSQTYEADTQSAAFDLMKLNYPDAQVTDTKQAVSLAASALGKLGGSSTSEAKQSASRENGKLGGRPKASS